MFASIPSDKMTPLSGMRERMLSGSFAPNRPYTRLLCEARLGMEFGCDR